MPDMLNRSPAWMDAHMRGVEEMSLKLFMRGIAQTMAEHRKAIERVVDEQVMEPESIEEALAEAPVPAGAEEENRSDLMKGVGLAMSPHKGAGRHRLRPRNAGQQPPEDGMESFEEEDDYEAEDEED